MKYLFLVAFLSGTTFLTAQTSLGVWTSIDDETGMEKSHVQIYEQNGKQYGKIVKLLKAPNHLCDKCTDYRKDQPILNMIIIEDMKQKGGMWEDGRVLYPRQGKWYPLQYWLKEGDPNTLVMRGHWGLFYRTQYWKRVN